MKKLLVLFLIVCTFASASMTFVNKQWQGATEMETYLEKLGYEVDYIVAVEGLPGSYIVLSKAGGTDGTLDIATLTVDEGLTQTAVPIIPLDAGATIPAGTSMLLPTSATANAWVILPTPVAGHVINILTDAGATGYEIRPALATQFINNTECTPNKELAVSSTDGIRATCTKSGAAGRWLVEKISNIGAATAGGTPD